MMLERTLFSLASAEDKKRKHGVSRTKSFLGTMMRISKENGPSLKST